LVDDWLDQRGFALVRGHRFSDTDPVVDTAAASPALNSKAVWWTWLRRAYAIAVLGVLGYLIWHVPDAFAVLSMRALDASTWIFVLAWALMAGTLGLLWARGLRAIAGRGPDLLTVMQVQGSAWAGRYLPGKIGLLAGKLVLAGRHGLDARALAGSVLFEQLAFIAAGIALAAACLDTTLLQRWLAPNAVSMGATLGWRLAAFAMAVVVAVGAAWAAVRTAGAGRVGALAWVALLYVLPHAICGFGLAEVLRAGGMDVSWPDAIGAMALANVAGVVAVFAPAGLGIREAVLVAVLPTQDQASVLAMIALVRILATLGDVLFIAFCLSAGALVAHVRRA
jgi:uncharacterized membrane protein YbhN (UPF0104 family)